MKNRIISLLIISFLIFTFIIFYKGLNKLSLYTPAIENKNIPEFITETFFQKKMINSKNLFDKNKFYLVNIWASWCVPCRDEHALLIELSKNDKLEIIGLNYKDNFKNAEKFINDLGNPYTKILLDKDGTKAISWGAFGVPETFLIYENKIIKRYIGPLSLELIEEIEKILK
jgi:cytochrome c biogenesis protein CcmG, thiol:disulfide interchange protein DsbE